MPNATMPALVGNVHTLTPAALDQSLGAMLSKRDMVRWLADEGVFLLGLEVAENFDYTVQTGPFRGLKYTRSAVLSRHATPMLIGQYERQLYPVLLAAAGRADLVIDLGHAEGYYAIGLARLGKRVVAFDMDAEERRICQEMVRLNHVADRVSIRRWYSASTLTALTLYERALIISDIEGAELQLFQGSLIPNLSHCDLIVELHGRSPRENDQFVRRFRSTHRVNMIDHPNMPAGTAEISFLGKDAWRMATEYRPFQQWMIARSNLCTGQEAGKWLEELESGALR